MSSEEFAEFLTKPQSFDTTHGFHGDIKDKLSFKGSITDGTDELSVGSTEHNPYSMTEAVLRERSKKRQYGNVMAQLFACFTLTLGSIITGYTIGSTLPKIRSMFNEQRKTKNHYSSDAREHAQFASIVALGLAFGNIFMTILCVSKGPRKVMIFTAPINFIACLSMPIINKENFQTAMMFICAFLSVSYVACGSILLTDFIHEAFFYVFFLIFKSGYGFGIMLAYIFGLSPDLEYYADGLGALIISVYFIMLFYCPESPVILYETNGLLAEKTLIFFRGKNDIQISMRHIAKDYQSRSLNVATKYMLFSPVVYKAMLIIAIVVVLQVFYGYHLFLMYNVALWSESSRHHRYQIDIIGQFEDGIILGAFYYIIPAFTQAINLRLLFGIRKPLLVSAIAIPICLSVHALYFYLLDIQNSFVINNQSLYFVVWFFYICSFNVGHALCIETMIADYLPEQMQVWASATIISMQYLILSFALWFTFMLEAKCYAYVIILCFTLVSLAGIPFCFYFIVESKGKTLQQIQLEIGGNPIGTRSSFRSRYRQYLESRQHNKQDEGSNVNSE